MRYMTISNIGIKMRGSADNESMQSVAISLLRGAAAVEVAAAHLRADMYPSLRTVTDASIWFNGFAFLVGFAHQSVLVFFVISGWLVGGSLLDKRGERSAFKNYAIDRLTRLWTVLIPTFVLTLLFSLNTGEAGLSSTGVTSTEDFSKLTFFGNLFGLQTTLVPPFGRNFPLWSLANETWYYIMFPLLLALFSSRKTWRRAVIGAVLLCLILVLPTSLTGYFGIWLLGVGFSRIKIECNGVVRYGWLFLTIAAWSYYRLTADLSKFDLITLVPDVLCSVMFLVVLSSLQFKPASSTLFSQIKKISTFFANFSFSLYVLHIPLMRLLQYGLFQQWGRRQLSSHEPLDFLLYLAMLSILLSGSYLSYLLFEARTFMIRRFVKRMLLLRAPAALVSTDKG